LKCFLRLRDITGHQEAKPIELRKVLVCLEHASLVKANVTRATRCDKAGSSPSVRRYNNVRSRRATSIAFSRLLKAEMRK
jgi:hypothetical protein